MLRLPSTDGWVRWLLDRSLTPTSSDEIEAVVKRRGDGGGEALVHGEGEGKDGSGDERRRGGVEVVVVRRAGERRSVGVGLAVG